MENINTNIDDNIDIEKTKIDKMSDDEVLFIWSNVDANHPYFSIETNLGKHFAKRFGKITLEKIRKKISEQGVYQIE